MKQQVAEFKAEMVEKNCKIEYLERINNEKDRKISEMEKVIIEQTQQIGDLRQTQVPRRELDFKDSEIMGLKAELKEA